MVEVLEFNGPTLPRLLLKHESGDQAEEADAHSPADGEASVHNWPNAGVRRSKGDSDQVGNIGDCRSFAAEP